MVKWSITLVARRTCFAMRNILGNGCFLSVNVWVIESELCYSWCLGFRLAVALNWVPVWSERNRRYASDGQTISKIITFYLLKFLPYARDECNAFVVNFMFSM